jgi:DNA adenine methylase
MKSIVRWAGSKRALLPELRKRVPRDFRTYIEPFVGSACLFFDLQPRGAVLSDLNGELMTAYRSVKRDPTLVIDALRRLTRGKRAYYSIRRICPSSLGDTERAARFLYLNRFCFNGLYRTNRAGVFNVPYGPPTKPLTRFEDDVVAASRILGFADLLSGDFADAVELTERGDFVYLDPPYVLDERRVFSEYLPGSFTSADLERLASALETIEARGATFLLSYVDSAEARKLVRGWKHTRVWTRRNIAGFAANRRGDSEILASNRSL